MASRRGSRSQVRAIFPAMGPWTSAALWHGLADRPAPSTPLGPEIDTIFQQRLTPLLLDYLRAHAVDLPASLLEQLRAQAFFWTCRSSTVSALATDALDNFRSAGIDHVVSKGPGIAAHYPMGMRPFSDVDVLVAPRDFGRATSVLTSLGYSEELYNRQPWPIFNRWCREGLNLTSALGGSLDLHHHIPPWWWARHLTVDRLLQEAVPTSLVGAAAPCLSAEANLLVAALHVVSDRNRPGKTLFTWRDVAQLASVGDWDRVVGLAQASQLEGWLVEILSALPEGTLNARAAGWAEDARPPVRRDLRRALTLSSRGRHPLWMTQPLRLPPPAAALFVAGMIVPSPSYLEAVYPNRRHRYLSWWRDKSARRESGSSSSTVNRSSSANSVKTDARRRTRSGDHA